MENVKADEKSEQKEHKLKRATRNAFSSQNNFRIH